MTTFTVKVIESIMLRRQSAVQRCHRLMRKGKQLKAAVCPSIKLKQITWTPTRCTTAPLLSSEQYRTGP